MADMQDTCGWTCVNHSFDPMLHRFIGEITAAYLQLACAPAEGWVRGSCWQGTHWLEPGAYPHYWR
jgi:hypothetical protein